VTRWAAAPGPSPPGGRAPRVRLDGECGMVTWSQTPSSPASLLFAEGVDKGLVQGTHLPGQAIIDTSGAMVSIDAQCNAFLVGVVAIYADAPTTCSRSTTAGSSVRQWLLPLMELA
jgi:hypothetical protein